MTIQKFCFTKKLADNIFEDFENFSSEIKMVIFGQFLRYEGQFFTNISGFILEKGFCNKNGGQRKSWAGQHIYRESGNQVPTKCMSSVKLFARIDIDTMPQVDGASLTKESKVL